MTISAQPQAQHITRPVLAYMEEGKHLHIYAELKYSDEGKLVSVITGAPVEEVKAHLDNDRHGIYMNAEIMSLDEYAEKKLAQDNLRFNVGTPVQITEADFKYMFNLLPPSRWDMNRDFEGFKMMEPLSGSLYTFYIRVKDTYFKVVNHGTTQYQTMYQACLSLNASPIPNEKVA